MIVKHLTHKHGGKITAIVGIKHGTFRRQTTVEFIGRIEWSDGSVSERGYIAPWALCRDSANPDACAELDAVLRLLETYFANNGTRDSQYNWIPNTKSGHQEIE